MQRRRILQLGTGLVTTSLLGTAPTLAQPQNGGGQPSVRATSDECGQLTITRSTTGPNKPVGVTATLSDGSAETLQSIGRGESVTIDAEPGEWEIESGHPAVVSATPTVTVAECEPEGPTLTITSPNCGRVLLERNDAGPERVQVLPRLERPDGSIEYYPDFTMRRGDSRWLGGAGTLYVQIITGWYDGDREVELIGSPLTVETCE